MAKRTAALGTNPLAITVRGGAPAPAPAARRTPAASTERVKAQLNVAFDSWEPVEWYRAAAHVLGVEQRQVLRDALAAYKRTLTDAQRRDIDAQANVYAQRRAVPDAGPRRKA